MTDSELFASFLKKYKIKNYSLERNKNQKYVMNHDDFMFTQCVTI